MKLVAIFQRLCRKIHNTRFNKFLLVVFSENLFKNSSFEQFQFVTGGFLKHLILWELHQTNYESYEV